MSHIRINIFLLCLFFTPVFIGESLSASEFEGGYDPFQSAPVFLPVDKAFRLSATRDDSIVKLYWQIQPGYYLYKHKLKVNVEDTPKFLKMAPGKEKHDEYFGDVEVYYEELEVEVSLSEQNTENVELWIEFQGCAEAGICYPPRKITISL
ncbi:MAG: hypothetical protein JKY88_01435 [Pseudomonadales bacterium]|nr:hypothetical protein [Pseudomonadales bacterium]